MFHKGNINIFVLFHTRMTKPTVFKHIIFMTPTFAGRRSFTNSFSRIARNREDLTVSNFCTNIDSDQKSFLLRDK